MRFDMTFTINHNESKFSDSPNQATLHVTCNFMFQPQMVKETILDKDFSTRHVMNKYCTKVTKLFLFVYCSSQHCRKYEISIQMCVCSYPK